MIAEFLEVTFSRHGTCRLLYDTSLALARSSPTRRYTGLYYTGQQPKKDPIRECVFLPILMPLNPNMATV